VKERIGTICVLAGFVLMPLAVVQGMNEAWSFGTEIVVGGLGFLLIFVGRGLRGGGAAK
jgi:hypothetical protein